MIKRWSSRLSTALHNLAPRTKRVVLAASDGAICGGVAAGLSGMGASAVWLGVLAAGAGTALSVLLGLDRTKLNSFIHAGIGRAALLAIVMAAGAIAIAMSSGAPAGAVDTVALAATFGGLVLSRALMLRMMLWALRVQPAPLRGLIYGAGKTGEQLFAALRAHRTILPVAFVDDNSALHGRSLGGVRIHSAASNPALARRRWIDRVLLAMPSQSATRVLRLSQRDYAAGLEVHALPSFSQLLGTAGLCDQLAPVPPDALLGRSERACDIDRPLAIYRGRSVLVTGAGGSVGSELCRHLMVMAPRRLVLLETGELALYTIHRELSAMAGEVEIVPILGSVCDDRLVRSTLRDQGVEVVLHAAAYKHVPLVEANPLAGLANNVLGTRVLAEAAADHGVGRFILISTDKAVRPTSMMGASKRLAELLVQDVARRAAPAVFSIVRFGNVLGSSGSVIPLFREQIAAGGPVTLTHDDVTRYFMTLAEAARLVLFAGALGPSPVAGAVYVLDMGMPIRIRDLAVRMIAASGLTPRDASAPEGDIEIRVIGLRPGEKLHESPLISADMAITPHPGILRANEPSLASADLHGVLDTLQRAIASGDADLARLVVEAAVQEPQSPVAAPATGDQRIRAAG